MNPEVKVQWLEALRSGEYKQGQGYLRYGERFCCLGVLCDLAAKAGVVEGDERTSLDDITTYGKENAYNALPAEVMAWSGMRDSGGLRNEYEGTYRLSLWQLNDVEEWTFDMIAEVIEKEF